MKPREEEREAVRTTIVGGRPPGSGRSDTSIPRGIEVLVKKAAVDEDFRQRLLAQRGGAAAVIGLDLDPAEQTMLSLIPEEHLVRIIGQTDVPTEQRRAFLGQMAAAMLAVLGVGLGSRGQGATAEASAAQGARPDIPPNTQPGTTSAPATSTLPNYGGRGNRPDRPPQTTTSAPATTTAPATSTGPSEPVSRGIRPDRPQTTTAPTSAAQRDIAPPELRVMAGDTADRPPQTESAPATDTAPAAPPADTQPTIRMIGGIMIDRP